MWRNTPLSHALAYTGTDLLYSGGKHTVVGTVKTSFLVVLSLCIPL